MKKLIITIPLVFSILFSFFREDVYKEFPAVYPYKKVKGCKDDKRTPNYRICKEGEDIMYITFIYGENRYALSLFLVAKNIKNSYKDEIVEYLYKEEHPISGDVKQLKINNYYPAHQAQVYFETKGKELTGAFSLYSKGRLEFIGNLKNGKLDGKWYEFGFNYKIGRNELKKITTFNNGIIVDSQRTKHWMNRDGFE